MLDKYVAPVMPQLLMLLAPRAALTLLILAQLQLSVFLQLQLQMPLILQLLTHSKLQEPFFFIASASSTRAEG